MSALGTMWQKTCTRFNVRPRQFAILLMMTAVGISALGVKMLVFKPKSAAADTAKGEADDRRPGRPVSKSSGVSIKGAGGRAGSDEGTQGPSPVPETLKVVAIALESRPVRDPFIPFFLYASSGDDVEGDAEESSDARNEGVAVVPHGSQPSAKGAKGTVRTKGAKVVAEPPPPPEGPQGILLKAIIAGKVAVLNSASVEEGDVITDDYGQTFTVHEIRERSLVLSDGRRTYPIGYASPSLGTKGKTSAGPKAPAAKTTKTK